MELVFRPMTAEDVAVYRKWFADTEMTSRLQEPDAVWEKHVFGSEPPRVWAVLWDGRMVGQIQVELYGDGTASVALAVAPGERGQGVGSRMLREFVRKKLSQVGEVFAAVVPDRMASRKCFEKAGFVAEAGLDRDGMVRYRLRAG